MNIPTNLPTRLGVSMQIAGVSGFDAFLKALLPTTFFARHVARKLKSRGRYVDWFSLPDGSEWDRDGKRLSKENV